MRGAPEPSRRLALFGPAAPRSRPSRPVTQGRVPASIELLSPLWPDLDEQAGTIAVTGKLVRIKGKGLVRFDDTKSDACTRTLTVAPLHDRLLV